MGLEQQVAALWKEHVELRSRVVELEAVVSILRTALVCAGAALNVDALLADQAAVDADEGPLLVGPQ